MKRSKKKILYRVITAAMLASTVSPNVMMPLSVYAAESTSIAVETKYYIDGEEVSYYHKFYGLTELSLESTNTYEGIGCLEYCDIQWYHNVGSNDTYYGDYSSWIPIEGATSSRFLIPADYKDNYSGHLGYIITGREGTPYEGKVSRGTFDSSYFSKLSLSSTASDYITAYKLDGVEYTPTASSSYAGFTDNLYVGQTLEISKIYKNSRSGYTANIDVSNHGKWYRMNIAPYNNNTRTRELIGEGSSYTITEDDIGMLISYGFEDTDMISASCQELDLFGESAYSSRYGNTKNISHINASELGEISIDQSGIKVGDVLTTTLSNDSLTESDVKYQWYRTSSDESNGIAINGATASSYTTTSDDIGKRVYVKAVSLNDSAKGGATSQLEYVDSLNQADLTSLVVSGSATYGQTLSAAVLPVEANETTDFKWYSSSDKVSWTEIGSGNSLTLGGYEVDKYIKVVAVGHGEFTGTLEKEMDSKVVADFTPLKSVEITGSRATNGTLNAKLVPEDATVNYQWQICDFENGTYTDISYATSSSYTVSSSYADKYIRLKVEGTGVYGGTYYSDSKKIIDSSSLTNISSFTRKITTDGTSDVLVGDTFNVTLTNGNGEDITDKVYWQWYCGDSYSSTPGTVKNYTPIPGATSSSYTLTDDVVGKYIMILAEGNPDYGYTGYRADYGAYYAPYTSYTNAKVKRKLSSVDVSGGIYVGKTLTATTDASNSEEVSYQWYRSNSQGSNGSSISGATSSTYTLTEADKGYYINCYVTGTGNTGGSAWYYGIDTVGTMSNCEDVGLEHNVSDWITTKQATCDVPGERVKICEDCGTVIETDEIPAADHNYVLVGDVYKCLNDTFIEPEVSSTNSNNFVKGVDGVWKSTKGGTSSNNGTSITFDVTLAEDGTVSFDYMTMVSTSSGYTKYQVLQGNHIIRSGELKKADRGTWKHVEETLPAGNYTLKFMNEPDVFDLTMPMAGGIYSEGYGYFKNLQVPVTCNLERPEITISSVDLVSSNNVVGTTASAKLENASDQVLYQWYRTDDTIENGVAIEGATSSTYTLTAEDKGKLIYVVATGDSSQGYVGTSTSGLMPAVIGKKVTNYTASGKLEVNGLLDIALYPSDATVEYQWYASDDGETWTPIDGAVNKQYKPTEDVLGKHIKVVITGIGDYDGVYTSTFAGVVKDPSKQISSVNIGGGQFVGDTITVSINPEDATVEYQWMISDTSDGEFVDIVGATSSSYTLKDTEAGKFIKVKITGTGEYDAFSYTSDPIEVQVSGYTLDVQGTARVGKTLHVDFNEVVDFDADFTWYISDNVDGPYTEVASGNSYKLTSAVGGKYVKVLADYQDETLDIHVESTPLKIKKTITSVNISGVGKVGQTLTLNITPADATGNIQWKIGDPDTGVYTDVDGETGSTYVIRPSDAGKWIAVEFTGTEDYEGIEVELTSGKKGSTSNKDIATEETDTPAYNEEDFNREATEDGEAADIPSTPAPDEGGTGGSGESGNTPSTDPGGSSGNNSDVTGSQGAGSDLTYNGPSTEGKQGEYILEAWNEETQAWEPVATNRTGTFTVTTNLAGKKVRTKFKADDEEDTFLFGGAIFIDEEGDPDNGGASSSGLIKTSSEEVLYTMVGTEEAFNGTQKDCIVYVSQTQEIAVKTPFKVVLPGDRSGENSAEFDTVVKGNISGWDKVYVVPQSEFMMYTNGKDPIRATVEQDKTMFCIADDGQETIEAGALAHTKVTAYGMSAGEWEGVYSYEIYIEGRQVSDSEENVTNTEVTIE